MIFPYLCIKVWINVLTLDWSELVVLDVEASLRKVRLPYVVQAEGQYWTRALALEEGWSAMLVSGTLLVALGDRDLPALQRLLVKYLGTSLS